MKGVVQIIKIAGIPVQVHWSFMLIFAWLGFVGWGEGLPWKEIAGLALLAFSLFFCVVLHEFGHAFAARHYGVNTRDIILLPIGGLARLERLPDKPLQEFAIAFAGPLVNFFIALFLSVFILLFSENGFFLTGNSLNTYSNAANFLPALFWLNTILFLFNLMPAFPMDGGRIFRALLSLKFGRLKATRISTFIGQGMAGLFFLYALLFGDLVVGMIAVFVFFAASSENKMVQIEALLSNNYVKDIMRTHYTPFFVSDRMENAMDELKRGTEKGFLVFDLSNQIAGVLTEGTILNAIKKEDGNALVSAYYNDAFTSLSPEESLKSVFRKMQQHGNSILPVFEKDQLAGVVDAGMLNNFLRLKEKTNFQEDN